MSAQSTVYNPTQNTSAATGDGFSVPRTTTAGRLAIPFTTLDAGMMVYDTTLNNLFIWTGAAWESVPASGDAGANGAVQYNDNGVVSGAPNFTYDKTTSAVGITGALTCQSSASFYTGTALPLHIRNSGTSFTQIGDNGTIGAGTAFIVGSSDASLRFQCGGAEQMRLNSNGLGVGGAPLSGFRLNVNNGDFRVSDVQNEDGVEIGWSNGGSIGFVQVYNRTTSAFKDLVLNNAATITASGNVGIGVTPSAWSNSGNIDLANGFIGISSSGIYGGAIANNAYYNAGWKYKAANYANLYLTGAGEHKWLNAPVGAAAGNAITFTQAMTLDASGRLLVGVTSAIASGNTFQNLGSARQVLTLKGDDQTSYTFGVWSASATGDNLFQYFGTEATLTVRGSISYNRAGGLVAYNTTSDYRAKDIIGPVSNSGSLIDSLKVYVGKMKGATIDRPMLIAHEAQEVAPYAVTGTKDEVDADGKPKYQQMDTSALVPLLIAEIQSLRARVQTLETR